MWKPFYRNHKKPGAKRPNRFGVERNRHRPRIESLEERAVPAILYSSTGARSIIDSGGPILRQMQVDLIFWGGHWNDPGANQTLRTNVQNTVNAFLNSPYFDGLAQYRGIIHGSLLRSDTITSSSPGGTFQTAPSGDLATMVANNINNGTLPSPNGQILYFVVPQPGATPSDCGGCGGRHLATFASGNRVFPYGLTTNPINVALDTLSVIISHELVEAASNPEWNVSVGGVNQAAFHVPGANGDEIGDGEAQNYTYRVNGALVQSYLSQRDHAYIVTNGSTNTFLVSNTGVLSFLESFGGFNQNFVNLFNNGVYAELNNSTAQFEPRAISAIQVNWGLTDGNRLTIAGTPVPVTVTGSGSNGIAIGAGGRVTNILASITVSGVNSAIAVDDSADPFATTVTHDTVIIGGLNYGRVSFGGVPIQYQYGGGVTATVHTGAGGSAVTVRANGVPTNLVGHGPNTTVTVGFAGRVTDILGPVTVTNPPSFTAVTVDDSADPFATSVTLDTVSVGGFNYGRISFGGVPIEYKYGDSSSVTLDTGTGGSTVNVRANGVATNVVGYGANTTVQVGDAGRLTNILGPVTVTNPPSYTAVTVDDSTDPFATTVTMDTVSVGGSDYGRISFGGVPIEYRYGDTSITTLHTGAGGATVNVRATGVPTNVAGHGANTAVQVGDGGSVQNIRGALSFSSPGHPEDVTVNDGNDSASLTPLLSTYLADTTFGQITGLAPAPIYYRYADTGTLGVFTGLNTATVNVQATGTIVDLGGNDAQGLTINLGNAGSVQQILGAMSLANDAGPLNVNFNSQNDAGNSTATLDDFNSGREFMRIVGLAPTTIFSAPTAFGGSYVVNGGSGSDLFVVASTSPLISTILNGGSGGNIFNVASVAAGTNLTINAGVGGPGDTFHITPTDEALADIAGNLTLNGSGSGLDVVEFFDQNNLNAETYTFDSVPSNLTLTTEPVSINFSNMGSIYLQTNGMSTVNDASGTVVVDGMPPSPAPRPGGSGHSLGRAHEGDSVALLSTASAIAEFTGDFVAPLDRPVPSDGARSSLFGNAHDGNDGFDLESAFYPIHL